MSLPLGAESQPLLFFCWLKTGMPRVITKSLRFRSISPAFVDSS